MIGSHPPNRDELLEAYLDGLLNDADRAAFEASLRDDPARRQQVELQMEIDGALDRLYAVETPSHEQLAAALASAVASATPAATIPPATLPPHTPAPPRGSRAYWAGAAAVAAALVISAMAALLWTQPKSIGPEFSAQPLAAIYQNAVDCGFEPTYECREADRFAATFQQRQGIPLQLAALPAGTRMLGLSYVHGLSRKTTAMLCDVDGKPVVVFVDRVENDQPRVAETPEGLHIFRHERDGLVFYEVTPHDKARVMHLLEPLSESAAPGA
jgi:anti-sigma-K factor RskA